MEHPIKMDDLGVPLFSEPPHIDNPDGSANNWSFPPWLETRFTNPLLQVIQQKKPFGSIGQAAYSTGNLSSTSPIQIHS